MYVVCAVRPCPSPSSSIVFWCGDLNYRIQTSDMVTVETIKKMADLYQLQGLVAKDQVSGCVLCDCLVM